MQKKVGLLMKVIILSDSHSYVATLEEILKKESFDAVIHLGDGASDMRYTENLTAQKPVYQLKGNCDFNSSFLPARFISYFDKVKFFACHGDKYNVKSTLISLMYAAKEYECALALFGHTHRPYKEEADGMCFFNPGSAANGSYGILETNGESFRIFHKSI